jgi:hypothetical protein
MGIDGTFAARQDELMDFHEAARDSKHIALA